MTSSSDGRKGPDQHLDTPDTDAPAAASASAPADAAAIVTAPDAASEATTAADAASRKAATAAATDELAQLPKEPVSPSTPERNGDAACAAAAPHLSSVPSPRTCTENASNTTVDQSLTIPSASKDADGDFTMSGQPQTQGQPAQHLQQQQQLPPPLPLPALPPHPPPPPPNVASVATSEPFASSTPFTPAQMANLDQHAYMMMALASMSGAQNAISPPPTVTPSQVTLPNLLDDGVNGAGAAGVLRQGNTEKGLESFARIEFADSVFQMTTYAVIIGRDQRALEQARRDGKRADEHQRRVEENASKGLPPPSPIRRDRSKFSKSYVSEEGGMLGPESDSEESGRPPKRRKTSTNGSSQQDHEDSQENIISNRQYVSHTPGAAAVDLSSLRPSPYHVPFIGIHSPGPNIAGKTKAISREHLKIAYNQQEGVFEAHPLHKNGFFCEDVHYKSDKVVLRCGDRLQIKDVDFCFIINGVEKGRTGAEEYLEDEPAPKKRQSHGGKEMSFDFEKSHGNGEVQDTSDELSDIEISPPAVSDGEEGEDEGEDEEGEEGEEAEEGDGDERGVGSEMKNESTAEPDPVLLQIPKKRGPGRPPKNGIMSKREQRLLKKQQQEMAKKTLPQALPVEPPIKRKVGRPRKHPLPEDAGDRPEKRKYKPRKPKEEGGEGSDAERRAREKKEKKARPKSPPLELKIEDYTDEQLQKPNKNYGVLIDETLTAAGPDGLTLKQIYKRICQRYPWFYFHTETKGWESSVRHNLIGNEAFKKDETTNLWSRVPGVELDAGKKRKASSPDRALAAQGYGPYSYPYNAAQHMAPGAAAGYAPGQAPAGYQVTRYPSQPGQMPRPMQPYAAAPAHAGQGNTLPASVAAQAIAPTQLPGYGPPPAPARAQPGGPQPGAYSSPYASRPPPPQSNAPVDTEPGRAQPGAAPAQLAPSVTPAAAAAAAAATVGAKTVPSPAAPLQTPTPGSRPSATPPTTAPAKPVIDPRLLSAVVKLKNGLVENLKKARNPKAEAIVMSALNRCVGLKKDATENDKMEAICIKGILQVIEGFNKNRSPAPGSPPPRESPLIIDAKVLASLNGFKDVSIKAIKGRLGEARAEAVALSAIDRVLGLADASIVPQGGEGESGAASGGNFEGVEQHLIKSIRQLLVGMNQKIREP
ncbi:forkhead domain-containing protein [Metarhizium rileyi]|uniref:Forkhead domain-containing protein n=1 Tax=Metarhizium rileyi (strain RCEF 4871) TaxID=1649241 RepID=A0A166WKS9_METRR|nr:forkhead domain-containing protein [Metarhizium rileyi RCEF 4871]